MHRVLATLGPALLLVGTTLVHAGELEDFIRASYTKFEFEIPMRDGVRLFTAVYVPNDRTRDYAIMLNRTPYSLSPYGVDQYRRSLGPSERFVREGFIFAYQDVRGRFMSEGEFIETTPHRPLKQSPRDVDESTDTWDTIEWLVREIPGNSGKVGMWGVSYPGFYAAAGMIDAHPALKAASPQAPVTDLFMGDDCFHNGAFFLAANFGFFTFFQKRGPEPQRLERGPRFDYGTPDGYQFFLDLGPLANVNERYFDSENPYWNDLMEHTTYDEFWKSRNIARFLNKVPPAVMTVGGWFDAEDLSGPFKVFRSIEESNPLTQNMLVVGPWSHGGWSRGAGSRLGDIDFGSKTAEFYRSEIEFPFFDYFLNGTRSNGFPKAWLFETGTNRWRRFDSWPPAGASIRSFYLGPGGLLLSEPPSGQSTCDVYVSDPGRPVPYLNGIEQGMAHDYMVGDQRFASKRTDVLVYRSAALDEDLGVVGPIDVDLFVSTTGSDSDFVVKLIDVFPADFPEPEPNPREVEMGGYQQLVRGEPFRAKFRNSFEKPEPMVPGEVTRIRFEMPDVCHVFRKGHRIMVQIQSSWFPLVDRNPQTFLHIPSARDEDFRPATQRVYRSGPYASSLRLRVEGKVR